MTDISATQSHSDLPTASKNPYAQRSHVLSSTQNRDPNSLPVVDSTNVAAKSPVLPPKLPGPYADRDIDYADDEMIDDYMEYDKDKPPDEYDPYIDDEFEVVEPSNKTMEDDHATTSASTEHLSHRTVPIFREEQEEHDENFADVEMVRQFRQTESRTKKDLYTFERFVDHRQWRAEKMASPMRAKKWKPSNSNNHLRKDEPSSTGSGNDLSKPVIDHGSMSTFPTTSESMVLAFLQIRHYGTTIIPKRFAMQQRRCTLPQSPIVGKTCVPMTLGDGTRVHIAVRVVNGNDVPHKDTAQTKQPVMSTSSFGVGIDVLLNRVRMNRRQHEYEKIVQTSSVNADDVNSAATGRSMKKEISEPKSPKSIAEASKRHATSQLWVDKHAPKTFAHLLSDERCNREVVRALRAWDSYVFHREPPKRPDTLSYRKFKGVEIKEKNQANAIDSCKTMSKDTRPDVSSRVILLSGPPGVGKTTLAHIVARHAGYRPIEVNGSDERTETALTDRVIRAMESSTLQFESISSTGKGNMHDRPNCLILDEIDGADAVKAIQALVEIIRADIPPRNIKKKQQYLRRPIIFICNNKFVPALKPLLPYAKQFDIYPPSTTRLVSRLRSILMSEDLSLSAGGNSLLNQLVVSSCGDIRSCLFTLQFAAATAKRTNTSCSKLISHDNRDSSCPMSSDISKTLKCTLNGEGLKDVRSDIVGTVTAVFQKDKTMDSFGKLTTDRRKNNPLSIDKIFDVVRSFGDNARVLDCLFMNLQRVSFIDPSFDRCYAVLEWMSGTDCYRSNRQLSSADGYHVEAIHTPAVAAATHVLCRVEQPQDLIYSIRDLTDSQYQMESNKALLQKFLDGLCLRAKISRAGLYQASTEIVPYALWILSAGEGSSALNRSVTSVDLLSKSENDAFEHHAAILHSLGLKHISLVHENDRHRQHYRSPTTLLVGLDPPIDRLIKFIDMSSNRMDIPPALKQMLSRRAVIDKTSNTTVEEQPRKVDIKPTAAKKESVGKCNFLLMGAKKAKALRSARSAARVGCIVNDGHHSQSTLQHIRLSNTGSGIPLSQVVKLKYVKGFTQAVSMPCRYDDLS